MEGQAKFPDWNKRDDIKSALKVGLILLLDEYGYPPVERDEVYVELRLIDLRNFYKLTVGKMCYKREGLRQIISKNQLIENQFISTHTD